MTTEATTTERIGEIKARLEAATPGPWRWRGNTAAKQIELQTYGQGGVYVMSFRRWGTQGAMPWFQSRPAGRIEPALEHAIHPQPHNAWLIDGIDHPDAQLIESAPCDIEFLLGELEQSGEDFEAVVHDMDGYLARLGPLDEALRNLVTALEPESEANDLCVVCRCEMPEFDEAHAPDCTYLRARKALELPEIGQPAYDGAGVSA